MGQSVLVEYLVDGAKIAPVKLGSWVWELDHLGGCEVIDIKNINVKEVRKGASSGAA